MKLIQKIVLSLSFLLFTQIALGQQYLKSLDRLNDPKVKNKPTFFQIQKEFNDYWAPLNVKNGKYANKAGVQVKAGGWKQFKRWEWYMQPRINPVTGEFPTTSTDIEWNKYKATQPQLKNAGTTAANWTNLGPNSSTGGYAGIGRVNCIAFHPTDNNTYWVGTPSGGLWKTTNNGTSWIPLTDNISSIGISNIIIPSDYATTKTIYISTGDRDGFDTRSSGVLKSIDGGVTWNTTGLTFPVSNGYMVSQLLLDPTNNSHIIATTTLGVYSTTNGGVNWTLINNTLEYPLIDIKAKPGNFNILYGSSNAGDVYKSIDGGNSWVKKLSTTGSRTMITVSTNDINRVYAVVVNSLYGLDKIYKSTNGGESFTIVLDGATLNLLGWNYDGSDLGGQGGYDLTIESSPSDANILFVGGINTWKSSDAGNSWRIVNVWSSSGTIPIVHADKHKLIYRNNGDLFEGNDGGVYMSTDDGINWMDKSNGIINSQMYKLGVSQAKNGTVITGLQDNGSKLYDTDIWRDVLEGDGMECIIDYTNADIQYASIQFGYIQRTDDRWKLTGTPISYNIGDGTLSGDWVTPYIIDPNDHNTLYVGYEDVWKTTNKGDTFTKISTINSDNKLHSMAIAQSNSNYIYISDYNNIKVTKNGGATWVDITETLQNAIFNSITNITVDYHNPERVWVTMGQYNGDKVFESNDAGVSWVNISVGLPSIPVFSLVQRKLNGVNQLYVGTDVGVFVKNENENWKPYSDNLPNVMVDELEIYYDKTNPNNDRLYAATYGRGLWVSPLITFTGELLTYVPDNNFEQALIDFGYDDVLDNYVLTSNINSVLTLDVSGKNITDLAGIEDFVSLTDLIISSNHLTTLNINKNIALENLVCSENQLTSLDISKNLALKYLECNTNIITDINVIMNAALETLSLSNNHITKLNISQNTALMYLNCSNNQLVNLNVKNGNNINFSYFNAINNPNLGCIEVDNIAWSTTNWPNIDAQTSFSELCTQNLTYVPDDNFEQTLIDLGFDDVIDDYVFTSNISGLSYLNVTEKNIKDLTGIKDFVSLKDLKCSYNQLKSLDVSNNIALESLWCDGNQLTSLNVSNNTALTTLHCHTNQLTSLDVSSNSKLLVLRCDTNQLKSLNVSNNTALEHLWFEGNQLTSLDISSNTKLWNLNCNNNLLTSLDVSSNIALNYLECVSNLLTSLDVNSNRNLYVLVCASNQLTSLDVSNNTALDFLSCYANQLTSLDVSSNTKLWSLNCNNNLLTSLDVSNNKGLWYLYCEANQLTSLDVSKNIYLGSLQCDNNKLSILDLSQNTKLTYIHSENNYLTSLDLSSNVLLTNLNCSSNQLININVKNGNNINVWNFDVANNPNLTCIEVDNAAWSKVNWTKKDTQANYSENCSGDDDADTVINSLDQCPNTPAGQTVNATGCSTSQLDSDNDGIKDNLDTCPNTPSGQTVNANGCATSQLDTDNDGIKDNLDTCPNTTSGQTVNATGCSTSQLDTDNDGIKDNVDTCPNTPTGQTVNADGCSTSQLDTDNDGIKDNLDTCPNTPAGQTVNATGCSASQLDTDNDGIKDNLDTCANTPTGQTVNATGCSTSQLDIDNDGIKDNLDTCPNTPAGESVNATGCSTSQLDTDNDGVKDNLDTCPNTPAGQAVNANGCFFLPANNFSIEIISETCPDKNNGKISISAQAAHNYVATINGANHNFTNNILSVSNLAPGTYNVCIKITGITFEQCFTLTIAEGKTVSGKSSVTSNKASITIDKGTAPYNVLINGINILNTQSPSFMLDVKHGDLVEVKTAVLCEGVFSKTIDLFEGITVYPNPTKGIFEITLPFSEKEVYIELFTVGSQLISKGTYQVVNGKVQLNLENKPTGVYVVKIYLDTPVSLTIIKE